MHDKSLVELVRELIRCTLIYAKQQLAEALDDVDLAATARQ